MMFNLDYNYIANVLESWDRVKKIPNYAEVVGEHVIRRMSGCNLGDRYLNSKVIEYVEMIDRVLSFLGPDTDLLEAELANLSHELHLEKNAGLIPQALYYSVRDSLINALEDVLAECPEPFTERHKQSWIEVCERLTFTMMTVQMTIQCHDSRSFPDENNTTTPQLTTQ